MNYNMTLYERNSAISHQPLEKHLYRRDVFDTLVDMGVYTPCSTSPPVSRTWFDRLANSYMSMFGFNGAIDTRLSPKDLF